VAFHLVSEEGSAEVTISCQELQAAFTFLQSTVSYVSAQLKFTNYGEGLFDISVLDPPGDLTLQPSHAACAEILELIGALAWHS
jgi:hypothetical protein